MDMEKDSIIKTGICRYGSREYRLFLCRSSCFPGTGDYEDPPEICDGRETDCYCIWLEDMINEGRICAGAGYYEQLCDALLAAESSSGFVKWINS